MVGHSGPVLGGSDNVNIHRLVLSLPGASPGSCKLAIVFRRNVHEPRTPDPHLRQRERDEQAPGWREVGWETPSRSLTVFMEKVL